MKKQFLIWLAAIVAIMTAVPAVYAQNTEPELVDGVYQIETAEDLLWYGDLIKNNKVSGAKFNGALRADIDLTGVDWIPLGDSINGRRNFNGFNGTFDGNGHTISNIMICVSEEHRTDNTTMAHTGFFGVINASGSVTNLHLRNVSVPQYTAVARPT